MRWKFFVVAAFLAATSCFGGVSAQSWLVTTEDSSVHIGENTEVVRSIASITKLMTVIAVLDHYQDPKEKIGKYTREQLIQLTLIKSDNKAAALLCDNIPGGRFECIRYMNEKAGYIGMTNSKFVEPTGLSPMNISTARDLVKLVVESSKYEEIVKASNTQRYSFKQNKKWVSVNNTNPLVGKNFNFLVSKTGTTNAAGQCLVMMIDTDKGKRVFVMLGIKKGRRALEAKNIVSI